MVNAPLARYDGLRVKETGDGRLAVYDEATDQGHVLSPVCAAVFRLADGTRSLTDLTAAVAQTHPTADSDLIRLALAELHTSGLLDVPLSEPDNTLSRRHALRRFAAVGAAAAAVPLISSLGGIARRDSAQAGTRAEAAGRSKGLHANVNATVPNPGLPVDVDAGASANVAGSSTGIHLMCLTTSAPSDRRIKADITPVRWDR
ncbi:hypothetical protein AB0L00_26905 [Actinoallomurus sp. NPDC052308]|uniref:hypothetical protein n=1 Tax=Actinoallomurus sp. NPDC052308 TaxID=3155530 RepID=UPI003425FB9A